MDIDDVMLSDCGCGGVFIGRVIPGGVIPLIHFQDYSDLERFAMGLLGWCKYFQPNVPPVFLNAWIKEG
uniref:Uncharacterized protein n=1 Tax=viral metagenome TaxID=1070528 RepID=A0A6M3IE31_9ZZZZ